MTWTYKKALRCLLAVFVIYGLLVSTHRGEFWPFSIYPMFSSAGRSWTKVVVRDVSNIPPDSLSWNHIGTEVLPGKSVALADIGVLQDDVANFVEKTETWSSHRIASLRKVFGETYLSERGTLILRAFPDVDDEGAVTVTYEPFMLFLPDSTITSPHLTHLLATESTW